MSVFFQDSDAEVDPSDGAMTPAKSRAPAAPVMGVSASGIGALGEETEIVQSHKPPSSLLLFMLIVVVGGGSLLLMRRIGVSGGLKLALPSIDYPVDAATVIVRDEQHKRALAALKSGETVVQVPLSNLQRNPFQLDSQKTIEELSNDPNADRDRARAAARAKRRKDIKRTLESLKVNSVITGNVPVARINGSPVMIGDTIGMFIVRAIHDRTVDLEVDGEVYKKSMGE